MIDANILRFDITVNYPMPMEVFQSSCYTEGNTQALRQKFALDGHEVDIARADAANGGSTTAVKTAQRQAAGHAVQEAFPTTTVARAGVTFGAAPTIIRAATGGRCAVDDEIAVAHILPHGILPFAPGLHPHVEGALDLIEDEEVSTLFVGCEGLSEGTGGNAPDLDDVVVRQGSQELGFVGQVDGARSELVDVFHDGRTEMLDDVPARLVAANVTVGALSVMGWVAVALDGLRDGRGVGDLSTRLRCCVCVSCEEAGIAALSCVENSDGVHVVECSRTYELSLDQVVAADLREATAATASASAAISPTPLGLVSFRDCSRHVVVVVIFRLIVIVIVTVAQDETLAGSATEDPLGLVGDRPTDHDVGRGLWVRFGQDHGGRVLLAPIINYSYVRECFVPGCQTCKHAWRLRAPAPAWF